MLALFPALASAMAPPYAPPPDVLPDELAPPQNTGPLLTREQIAMIHAPVHYQDTHSAKWRADLLAAVDYDGDLVGWNNWENLQDNEPVATVYTSVVETCTHWFVVYAFFHPQDWGSPWSIVARAEHENDIESMLAIVAKDGGTGRLDGIITNAHLDFYSFVPPGSPLVDGEADIDGSLSMELYDGRLHAMTSQEAEGHGLKAWPFAGNFQGTQGDGVSYVPAWTGAAPASGDERRVPYALVFLDALWETQLLELVGSSRVDLQACKLEYSIVSPK